VKKSKYGRGIFATREIQKGELIHVAPVIVSSKEEFKYLKKTILINYVFSWGENYEHSALALGYGSLFNHSYTPNALYKHNLKKETIKFYAHTDIKTGEEILVNYNGEPDDNTPVWFEVT
jgi:SET domain-containing protein